MTQARKEAWTLAVVLGPAVRFWLGQKLGPLVGSAVGLALGPAVGLWLGMKLGPLLVGSAAGLALLVTFPMSDSGSEAWKSGPSFNPSKSPSSIPRYLC